MILVLIIAGIILGVYFGTRKSSSGHTATATPTSIPSPTATLLPTATAPPSGRTGGSGAKPTATVPPSTPTPKPAAGAAATPTAKTVPTPTAKAAATSTPKPTTPPPSGLKLGTFTYKQSTLQTIQNGADAGNSSYTFYLDPFKVVKKLLPQNYGFSAGPVTIVAPPQPPQPTPTPYSDAQGLPAVKLTVQYQGKRYVVVLDQPETQGANGIWIITQIKAA